MVANNMQLVFAQAMQLIRVDTPFTSTTKLFGMSLMWAINALLGVELLRPIYGRFMRRTKS